MHLKKNLNRGIIVDPQDEHLLHKHLFYVNEAGYVVTNSVTSEGKRIQLRLHRLILPGYEIVDHKSRNKLDNRRENLRPADKNESARNKNKYECNASKYKGVTQVSRGSKLWEANIRVNNKKIYLGQYLTQEEAAVAYNAAAKIHHKEFAVLNEIGVH